MSLEPQPEDCLAPSMLIDSGHPGIQYFAKKHAGQSGDHKQMAISLYLAVRDQWRYDPYHLDFRPESMKASAMLDRQRGHCVEKATLLAAVCRAAGIPSRVRFANVRNHIGTARLEEFLGSNLLVFHGFTELFLDGKWRKATPAFNKELCDHLGVAPLEFDGENDSIFQEFDAQGGKFMEYEYDYGPFVDLPRDLFIASLRKHYGHLFDKERVLAHGMSVQF